MLRGLSPCYRITGGIDYTVDDADYLALMGRNYMVLGVNKDAPFQTAEEFIAYAKANEGKVTIGNSGAGGANHIATEGLAMTGGFKIKAMPFQGASAAITACVGNHIDAVMAHPAEVIPHVKSGNLKAIMVLENDRIADFPDVPTAKEAGIDFTWAAWKGVIAPKNMPNNVKTIISEALDKVFKDEEFLERMKALGETVDYIPGEKFKELAVEDSKKAEEIIRSLGLYGMNAKK